jgi:hypothetical protein
VATLLQAHLMRSHSVKARMQAMQALSHSARGR